MILDALGLPSASTLETGVCIVGAGPAGIAIARELIGAPFSVCLVESGGLAPDASTEELGRFASVETQLAPGKETRRRQFGGTANAWDVRTTRSGRGVRYVPFDEIDFEKREWVPNSGWPFTKPDLQPYYERAHTVCGIGPFTYEAVDWEEPRARPFPLDATRLRTVVEQYGSADVFLREHRESLRRAANVTVALNATAVRLEERPGGGVDRLRVRCLDGRHHEIRASVFVLATGAIENARLLLLSNETRAAGIGNQNDLVGRFFMDHHNVRAGTLWPADPRWLAAASLYDLREVRGAMIMGKLVLAAEALRSERLLHAAARIEPRRPESVRDAFASMRQLASIVRDRGTDAPLGAHLARMARGLPYLLAFELPTRAIRSRRGRYGWSALSMPERRFASFGVELQVELSPDADNRVVLGEERDRFGRPLPAVSWKWRDAERSSVGRVRRLLSKELERAGLGWLETAPLEAPPDVLMPGGIHHHMGTTRMHDDERRGVVDSRCRVHGTPNLFVAGSSVFPTGGYANPTLTVVALSIRLADHIKSLMRA